ncbi:MAG TPA: hypothetical protein DHV59_01630 [Oxalobacteraceae bacterium]|nr:hypothetical protein [Oxalobacteraceae bacterium]
MSNYLSANELADLIGCQSNQRSCMTRWLDKNRWPYVIDIMGFPKVSKAYHDSRMSGIPTPPPELATEPDFSMFDNPTPRQLALKARRETKGKKL